MSATPDLRSQLESLSIRKDQRPQAAPRSARGPARSILVLVVLAAVVGGIAYAQRTGLLASLLKNISAAAATGSSAEVTTIVVRATPAQQTPAVLTATGKIVSDHQVEVATKVSGQIVALNFEQGDRVKSGQVLARIEDVTYRARRDEAAAMLNRAQATAEFEKFNYERVLKLAAQQRASEVEVQQARKSCDEALSVLSASKAQLDFAAKLLADCEVIAPISGVVLERNVEVGDFVAAEGGRGANANAQFGAIADMTKLRVEVDVSELDIGRLFSGMPCVVTPDAYKDRQFSGKVLWIDPGANYAKATVQVKVRIENPDDCLRVEGTAKVEFRNPAAASTPAGGASSIWIPASAIRIAAAPADSVVFVVTEGRARQAAVRVGRTVGAQVEIVAGLVDGQTIVAPLTDAVADGTRVKP